ncbi:protein-L-isoaspartate(D-aspartate) O-methyltransferase [Paramicrobacterium agarici]|uniref:protein-L-isoaspartate(D-aspartate) O-methyltransferase n=1 Tax=Paramicrobacterium agarici TaxID=630514 RepID=UPI0011519DD0|nr:protein-L-isoaspartate(D-aspartate) O-methyltransferase [Microbacterium agarici]TQO21244.1 protein-L-isoaspartate(D-aspartate) O-methyltransferase [Microbacterium agarici]
MGTNFERERERMLREHLVARDITDERVLSAMAEVPRERFVPERLAASAYEDHPLPLSDGQTISQPYIVAATLQAAAIDEHDVVLDIGTGSGYAAAVASKMAASVVSIERIASLSQQAASVIRELGYDNIELLVGDGAEGARDLGPFDAIVCAAAVEQIPSSWSEQLTPGGRIVAPVGGRAGQRLRSIRRDADGEIVETDLGGVVFVPLISES